MSTIRTDPVSGRKVIIATDRADRPRIFRDSDSNALKTDYCPFCLGNEEATPSPITTRRFEDSEADWEVRVVPNKYPAVSTSETLVEHDDTLHQYTSGVGAHEVIIESSEHVTDVGAFSSRQLELVFEVWRERIADLARDERLTHALLFKNHGEPAGASIEHAHSQLLALPMVPETIREELDGSKSFYDRTGECVFCRIIEETLENRDRLVYADEHVVALTPFASRFPFELWLLPREHESTFEETGSDVESALADATLNVLRRLRRAADAPPYNLVVHSTPLRAGPQPHFHWHFELIPTLSHVAGFEWGSGYHINPTSPEEAADHLRDIDLTASNSDAPGPDLDAPH